MPEKQTIIDLEKKFWETMVSKDADAATDMMAKTSIVTGPQGVAEVSRGDFGKMMEEGKWTLDSYKFSDVQLIFPNEFDRRDRLQGQAEGHDGRQAL